MDSRSGDRPHWLFSSSLLFSRSALDEGVRAPELVLLSASWPALPGRRCPLHLRTRAPERVGRGLKRSAMVRESGAGVKPGGLCRAPHSVAGGGAEPVGRSGAVGTNPWGPAGRSRTLSGAESQPSEALCSPSNPGACRSRSASL